MAGKENLIKAAKEGSVIVRQCVSCNIFQTSTTYFCTGCGGNQFADKTIPGKGAIATYTIITVPPAGFEEYTPYAFVVMTLNDSNLRISGFMSGIAKPEDLPVGAAAQVYGYDERGLLIQKL